MGFSRQHGKDVPLRTRDNDPAAGRARLGVSPWFPAGGFTPKVVKRKNFQSAQNKALPVCRYFLAFCHNRKHPAPRAVRFTENSASPIRSLTIDHWPLAGNSGPIHGRSRGHSMQHGNAKFRRNIGRKPKPKPLSHLFSTSCKSSPLFSSTCDGRFRKPFIMKHLLIRKNRTKVWRRQRTAAFHERSEAMKYGKNPPKAENKNANPFVFSILAITGLFSPFYLDSERLTRCKQHTY